MRGIRRVDSMRSGNWKAQGGWLGAAAVLSVLIIAIAPQQGASAPFGSTLKAPFKGSPVTQASTSTIGCATNATVPIGPNFNVTKGVGVGEASTTAKFCSVPTNFAAADFGVGLNSKFFHVTTGTHHAIVNWTLTFSWALVAAAGSSRTSAYAYAFVEVTANIQDITNSSYIAPTNSYFVLSSTSSGSLSHKFSAAPVSLFLNGTFVKNHLYVLYTDVYVEVYCDVGGSAGPGHASAKVIMGSDANGAKLLDWWMS